jgi:ATP-dependent helicase STH1/SNF2
MESEALERQFAAYKLLAAKVAPLPSSGYALTDIDVTAQSSVTEQEHLRHCLCAASDYPAALLTDLVAQCLHGQGDHCSNSSSSPHRDALAAKARETMASLAPPRVALGILPADLALERERLIQARLAARLQELSLRVDSNGDGAKRGPRRADIEEHSLNDTSNNVNEDEGENEDELRRRIELKSLQLFEQRRRLRLGILQQAARLASCDAALNNKQEMEVLGRQLSLQGIRPFRAPLQLVADAADNGDMIGGEEKGRRPKHAERLMNRQFSNLITEHAKEFAARQKARETAAWRTAKAVQAFHVAIEKEEQRKQERLSRERIKALRADDEEAYLKLLDQQKDTRLAYLLNQTNQFLGTLSQNVRLQQSEASRVVVDTSAINVDNEKEEEDKADYYQAAHKIREPIVAQPRMLIGGVLKEYQLKGLEWLVSLYNNRLNGILADEMGLGKTIQTIGLISYLMEAKNLPGPFLIVVPLSTLTNWSVEFERWAPSVVKVEYKGAPQHRKQLQQSVLKSGRFNVLLTTYEYVLKDKHALSKPKWLYMIIDEGHRMKNAHSKLSLVLTKHYASRFRLILTGTPLQNSLPELWSLLNFVLPKIFNSAKTFDEWFNAPFANFGIAAGDSSDSTELNEEETLLIIRRLHKVLRPFLLRRLKKDVEADLPDKLEITLKCPMSALQQHLYQVIKDETINQHNGNNNSPDGNSGGGGFRRLNNTIMQLRKICNHPFTFQDVEDAVNPTHHTNDLIYRAAGKFELLQRALPKFLAAGHRMLVFFQMTQVMTIMEDLLAWMGIAYLRLDGATKSEDRSRLLHLFNEPDSPYGVFLLSTRAGGLGLNLQTADTVIIFDSDWNPHQDLQAQDRAHRIGQTKQVRIYRLVTTDSVEEYILEKAQFKLSLDGKVIQAGRFDHKSTNEERELLLRAILEGERQPQSEDGDNQDGDDGEDDGDYESEDEDYVDDDDLNELLGRNDAELEMFRSMDLQRAKESGDKKRAKKRLMTHDELPAIYRKKPSLNHALDHDESSLNATGRRARKPVNYDETMTDRHFNDIIDSDAADSNDGTDAAGSTDDPDSNTEITMMAQSPKRIKLTMAKGKGKKEKNVTKTTWIDDVQRILDGLEDVCDEEGRCRVDLFRELPSRRQYPDYYRLIEKPMSLSLIRRQLLQPNHHYAGARPVFDDLDLIFQNAMVYNSEGSQVYGDAVCLREHVRRSFAPLLS